MQGQCKQNLRVQNAWSQFWIHEFLEIGWVHKTCDLAQSRVWLVSDRVRRSSDRVRRSSEGCDVAQMVVRQLAVRQARVRFSRLGIPGRFFPLSWPAMRRWRGTSTRGDEWMWHHASKPLDFPSRWIHDWHFAFASIFSRVFMKEHLGKKQ